MATLVLSAAGAAIGGAVGGAALGLSSVAIGRFAGALLGNAIDQRVMGQGSDAIETGRIDRYRITGSAEGHAISQIYGRMRIGGHVIWASRFQENIASSGGGKGAPSQPKRNEYSYSVSLAIALCEGEISGVTRLWADANEIALSDVTMRVYRGDKTQLPDAKIEAVEGAGTVPAYRGTAYVVFEDLDLGPYGNRIPQFSFEVSRPSPSAQAEAAIEPTFATQAVALIPGSGEYSLAKEPVYYALDTASHRAANLNAPSGQTDFVTAMGALETELPNCNSVSLIVSWFGDDLRCGECTIQPKVETQQYDGSLPWQVAGIDRNSASVIAQQQDRPIYGGTPADATVLQAISHLKDQGKEVMYYPFILMDQLAENGLADPYSEAGDQAFLPWRGRITLSKAPEQPGSPDGTAQAEEQIATFFGTANAADFSVSDNDVAYSGPQEWRYRRFILHQAALCAAAGGVDAFCIGSEMRGLTWLRGALGQFEAVAQLVDLATEVRALLGPNTKIGYAADWSEYFGYQPQDGSGDLYFHLDPLWADANIDFIGIDNYMPLSDWRDGKTHLDADYGSIYALDYLQSNIEGGEGYDWFYHSPEAEAAQIRTAITDGSYAEPWVYRYKDLRNWWQNDHHNRIAGTRQSTATPWVPRSKPIWFTELGCAAIDKATNQPNVFLDPKSAESKLPKYSNGQRDEYIQTQYLKAMFGYWGDPAKNPISPEYDGRMIDMSKAFVWAWDARPFPRFPQNKSLWSDGGNYDRGHWVSGRTTHRTLSSVVREICDCAQVVHYDVSGLHGMVRGYEVDQVGEPRRALQPLMLQYGFDAVERDGVLHFVMRGNSAPHVLSKQALAVHSEISGDLEHTRLSAAEMAGRVRVNYVEAMGDFHVQSEEAILPDEETHGVAVSELNLSLLRGEARQVAEKWLMESRVGQDVVRFALPMSRLGVSVGELVQLTSQQGLEVLYRIDRIETGQELLVEAVRVEPSVYDKTELENDSPRLSDFVAPLPVKPLFMDLPFLTGDEIPHAPHLAIAAQPWPGVIALYDSTSESDFQLNQLVTTQPTVGVLETALSAADPGRLDRGTALRLRLISGSLESISHAALLNGANAAVIGDGTPSNWEVIQFQTANLVGQKTYEISQRLRGQLGSDALDSTNWPAGSWFVLLNAVPEQIDLAAATRGVLRSYRVGPAQQPLDHASYVQESHSFAGNGLRPYAPVHLDLTAEPEGSIAASWVRRTRIDGDSWDGPEVPLGEEAELYIVRVFEGADLRREVQVSTPEWRYSIADQIADGVAGLLRFQVTQVSARFGEGLGTSQVIST
ncbi:glycoside hydrolase TIM-barrel-like domain-containing protein [Cognatishimia sp. WU-CL00825]|uniref:baseplate multidomain protein megatron n=1 Tax=Cognatishimia sp. WU-CL00825 TaxID=3127658 RepID=UPI0031066280